MDMTGTSVAQSVAAAPHTAQQVAVARARRESDRDRAVRRVRDAFEAHLRSLEESDQDQAAPRLHVDDRLPQRSIADELYGQARHRGEHHAADNASPDTPATDSDDAPVEGALYRHLDLTA